MTRFAPLALAAGLAAAGCGNKAESTAPSKDPGKPDAPRKLTVTGPAGQSVTQDRTDEMTVSVSRAGFSSPVAVELKDLPRGVTVETRELTLPADKGSLVVTVKAAPDAPAVVDHVVQVTARATDQADIPPATTTFKLTVKTK